MQIVALIHKSPHGYGVSFPDLPGCIAVGKSAHEALTNAADAAAFHIEGMIENDEQVPQLRELDTLREDADISEDFKDAFAVALVPFNPPSKAVRLNITLDQHLLDAIDRAAEEIGLSRSGLLADAARRRIAGLRKTEESVTASNLAFVRRQVEQKRKAKDLFWVERPKRVKAATATGEAPVYYWNATLDSSVASDPRTIDYVEQPDDSREHAEMRFWQQVGKAVEHWGNK